MGEVFRQGGFADYRAIGMGVAIMPSVSAVIPAINKARNLEHFFSTIETRIDDNRASVSRNLIIIKSGIKELTWS